MAHAVSRRQFLMSAAAAGAVAMAPRSFGQTGADILFQNGRIVDGTNGRSMTGDVLVRDGVITAVSETQLNADVPKMDCSGLVISPGFIDIHAHTDWTLPRNDREPLLMPFTEQGVTTFVGGNCGHGTAAYLRDSEHIKLLRLGADRSFDITWRDMSEFFDHLRSIGLTHNLANLVGHGTTRASIRGHDAREMSPDEMKTMLGLMERGMEQGAHGVSFGLQYQPGIFATLDEIKAVARLVKEHDKTMTCHMKAYSNYSTAYPIKIQGHRDHNLLAVEDMINVARETGVRLQMSHLIFVGTKTWPGYTEALSSIDNAIQNGIDIKFDTYPYHLGFSVIDVFFPAWFRAEMPEAFDSEGAREKLRKEMAMLRAAVGFDYSDIQVTYHVDEELNQYNGLFVNETAEKMGVDPFDCFMEIAQRSGGRARVLNHKYSNPEIVEALIKHPASLFMTDALVAAQGVQNPAAFGTYPRFLEWCRDKNLIPIEEAVYKMTGGIAERFDFGKRGFIKEGHAADITVFNWDTIKDNNTTYETDQRPNGIEAVFINGVRVLKDGKADPKLTAGVII